MYLGVKILFRHPPCTCWRPDHDAYTISLTNATTVGGPRNVVVHCSDCRMRFEVPIGKLEMEFESPKEVEDTTNGAITNRIGLLSQNE